MIHTYSGSGFQTFQDTPTVTKLSNFLSLCLSEGEEQVAHGGAIRGVEDTAGVDQAVALAGDDHRQVVVVVAVAIGDGGSEDDRGVRVQTGLAYRWLLLRRRRGYAS